MCSRSCTVFEAPAGVTFPAARLGPYWAHGERSRSTERAERARSGQTFEKDPAKPTRAKASRPDSAPLDAALADLLNPAIGRGRAGVGSQTGIDRSPRHLRRPATDRPGPADVGQPRSTGPQPRPPRPGCNRRPTIRSTAAPISPTRIAPGPRLVRGFDEAPQQGYVGKTPVPPGELDPDLARSTRHRDNEENDAADPRNVITPDMGPAHLRLAARRRPPELERSRRIAPASNRSTDCCARAGRNSTGEGASKIWMPHRPERPEKTEGGRRLVIKSDFDPKGDQPQAIADLVEGAQRNDRTQVLLGVTGSGKTFTMAKVIEATQRPALILAPNKTLAAQLYGEFRSFFPDNAVEYFVSYYDYYQPEAYIPRTDTYIEKDSSINEQIDRMRHSATRALLERDDVVIVASVSCIYGIGSVETYSAMTFSLKSGERLDQRALLADLVALQYKRTAGDFYRGSFRVRGDAIEIFPAHYEDRAWRVSLFGDEVESIHEFDPLTGQKTDELEFVKIYANSHYVTPRPTLLQAIAGIKHELRLRLEQLNGAGRLLEAQRLEQRTLYDLEMMEATGACAGIENYSRYLTGRKPGEPPPTLFEYVPDNALVFTDESHVTIPQLGGMYRGDFRRKATLAEYGFRLPSCMDNRPLRFEEWDAMRPQTVARLRHARPVGAQRIRRRFHRAGHPPDRPDRSAGRYPPGAHPGRRPGRRSAAGGAERLSQPRHRADQAHGRGFDRIPA